MFMAGDWYWRLNDLEPQGPVPEQTLMDLAARGVVARDCEVRLGLEGRWVSATRVKGLFPGPPPPPKVPTPPASQPPASQPPASRSTGSQPPIATRASNRLPKRPPTTGPLKSQRPTPHPPAAAADSATSTNKKSRRWRNEPNSPEAPPKLASSVSIPPARPLAPGSLERNSPTTTDLIPQLLDESGSQPVPPTRPVAFGRSRRRGNRRWLRVTSCIAVAIAGVIGAVVWLRSGGDDDAAREQLLETPVATASLETDPVVATGQPVALAARQPAAVEWRSYSPRTVFNLPQGVTLRITSIWRASVESPRTTASHVGLSAAAASRPVLCIEVQIQGGQKGSTPYSSWNGTGSLGHAARADLLDSADRLCPVLSADERPHLPPAADVALEPGQPIRDVLVFDLPPEAAGEMRLRLPLAAMGVADQELGVRILAEAIGTDPPLGQASLPVVDTAPKSGAADGLKGVIRAHAEAKAQMPSATDASPIEGQPAPDPTEESGAPDSVSDSEDSDSDTRATAASDAASRDAAASAPAASDPAAIDPRTRPARKEVRIKRRAKTTRKEPPSEAGPANSVEEKFSP